MITVRGSSPMDPGKYTSAIFFDNDHKKIKNIENICPLITRHLVNESEGELRPIKFNKEPIKSIIASAGGIENTYYDYLLSSRIDEDYYDPISGINPDIHGPLVKEWMASLEVPEDSIVLFDWDRTITVFEGFYFPPSLNDTDEDEEFVEDCLRYIMGGDERLAAFRDLCSEIGFAGVSIGILTNNGNCNKDFFKALVEQLIPDDVENLFIICSRPEPFFGHKGFKLQSIDHFSDICNAENNNMSGGLRRRRQRRSRKNRRKSRRGRKTNRRMRNIQ